jgi:hypothetical protein
MRAERLDIVLDGVRQLVRLRQRDAVVGRHDHGRRKAGEGQVRGREAIAGQVAATVGEALGDRVEGGEDTRAVVVERRDLELAAGPALRERVERGQRARLPGRSTRLAFRTPGA